MPTSGLSGDKYLTIQFWETFDKDSLNLDGEFRYWHTPWLQLVDVTGFTNNGSRIVLAKITLGTGAAAGQITALSQDLRQSTALPVGSVHFLTPVQSTAAGNTMIKTVEAGVLQAKASGGLDLTVPNASDEVHLERSDGGNFAEVSLGAEQIVARQANGQETVIIDTAAGSISATVTVGNVLNATNIGVGTVTAANSVNAKTLLATNVSASGSVTGSSLSASGAVTGGSLSTAGNVSGNSIQANTIYAGPRIRQNSLYLSGGPGWSSFSYNARHENGSWVFPDPSRTAVTIEMDDVGGAPRFQVWSTTPGNTRGWQPRFFVDGNTGNTWIGGNLSFAGNLFGKYGDASQAHWGWLWAQNSIAALDISLAYPQPLFAFIALTSINHFQVQPSGTGNFAYITGVDGGNPLGRPIGDPANSVWSGTAQRISFRLQSTSNSQAWAVAVVFRQQV